MAQYTSTQTTPNGVIISATQDTSTNKTTYTASDPFGVIGTVTKTTGDNSGVTQSLVNQINASYPGQGSQADIGVALGKVSSNVNAQAAGDIAPSTSNTNTTAPAPVVTQATPQQLDLSSPESSPTPNPPASEAVTNTPAQPLTRSLSGTQSTSLVTATPDWRVRISLAGGSYLYNAAKDSSNILFPLKATSGVVFPYTPTIQTAYRANYEGSDITHANYKQYFYKNSSVEEITIIGEFTAQDNAEAQYVLAVIHFFKSVTKMFYGKDTDPVPGTPPPLCFLNGYGPYQFNDHLILISNFQYSLPNDVDYVRTEGTALSSASKSDDATPESKLSSLLSSVTNRLKGNNLQKGGTSPQPTFNNLAKPDATYVPSKITITITAIPIVTRNDISKNFSVADYASGKLLLGNTRNPKGGIW